MPAAGGRGWRDNGISRGKPEGIESDAASATARRFAFLILFHACNANYDIKLKFRRGKKNFRNIALDTNPGPAVPRAADG